MGAFGTQGRKASRILWIYGVVVHSAHDISGLKRVRKPLIAWFRAYRVAVTLHVLETALELRICVHHRGGR